MRVRDLLSVDSIQLNVTASDKNDVIQKAVDLMQKRGNITDREAYVKGVFLREEEGTTGIGEGIAIPHCKGDAVSAPGLSALVIPQGVDYDSLDGEPVTLLFLIAAPNTEDNIHLDVLSKLSVLLMDEAFTNRLRTAESPDAFLSIIDAAEEADAAKSNEPEPVAAADGKLKILAVTACPTGIAHTYMAAESIEKKAKERGHWVKVETRGSGGAKNVLTADEIAAADCIIVAADTNVPMDRFDGKPVIQTQVSVGIGKSDMLIEKAESGTVPIYHSSGGGSKANEITGSESVGRQIYKHLMSGVSHMLPFVVGGGILIALSFMIDSFSVDLSTIADKTTFGTITPLAALFNTIGGTAFSFMLPILAGFIAMSIADRPGLALGVVGGSMAATGTSGFLGALILGFAAGYIVLLLKKVFANLPEKLDGIKPVLLYPLCGILLTGLLATFIVEPVFGGINTALYGALDAMNSTGSVLLGVLLGGMMAVDLGGPVNKAAYVFGVASIASGNYDIMAAVMVGGMTPPLAVAAATMLYKNKFTAEEIKAGPTNIVMGLSFISEGAIPYAAADPLHVLPPLIAGSALAGGLSMLFNCTLMAPHGGIFVFPLVGNALLYLLALAAGTVLSTFLLGIFKKKVVQ
ncbi:MAG: fructose-specific PTS transporter subunit EIIC [Lachnospiraceae bacterium]